MSKLRLAGIVAIIIGLGGIVYVGGYSLILVVIGAILFELGKNGEPVISGKVIWGVIFIASGITGSPFIGGYSIILILSGIGLFIAGKSGH